MIYGGYQGYQKGLFLELVALASLVVALLAALKLLDWGVALLQQQFPDLHRFLPYMAFVLLFVASVFLVNLLGRKLQESVEKNLLGEADQVAGALAGALKWAFMISLALWISGLFGYELGVKLVKHSWLYPFVLGIAPATFEFFAGFMPYIKHLLDTVHDIISQKTT